MIGGLILTGGASSRMGRDKAALDVGGVRAVDRLARLAVELGAATVLTVGGQGYGHPHLEDAVPLGGPVGGVAAGVGALAQAGCSTVLVLAVDAPTLRPEDIAPLFGPAQGAAFAGQPLPFVAPLTRFPEGVRPDWPVARLLEAWSLARLPVPLDAASRLRGANTPREYDALVQALTAAREMTRG